MPRRPHVVRASFPFALVFALVCAVPAAAQDWPNWRGPNYDGSQTAKNLPTDFTTDKHVEWKVELPGPGACTPIVVGDHVFLTAVDTARSKLVAMGISRSQGKVLWRQDAGSGWNDGAVRGGNRSNYASPSPVVDGERVIFFFGNGDLAAFSYDGAFKWRRNLQETYGEFAFQWTFSASPTVWEGRLYIPVLQRDHAVRRGRGRARGDTVEGQYESFILAMDPATGEVIYRHKRPSDARKESLESYATLIPYVGADGRKELICVGGDVITGHDPKTGKELWRWGTWNEGHREQWWRLVPSPVIGDGHVLVCAPKRAPIYAVKLGASGTQPQKEGYTWASSGKRNPISSDVPTPAYSGGSFYVLSDVQFALSRVDARTGDVKWTTPLSRDFKWRASPTVADGKVFLLNHGGEAVVVDCESGRILHSTPMAGEDEDLIRSSVVVAYDRLFIRTNDTLFCIGQ